MLKHNPTLGAMLLLVTTSLAAPVVAQQRPGPLILTPHPLRSGAYWTEGDQSNTGFIVGDSGVIVIDSQSKPEGARKALV